MEEVIYNFPIVNPAELPGCSIVRIVKVGNRNTKSERKSRKIEHFVSNNNLKCKHRY
jgi:hypothetical protein